ncbi:polysaccharide deacetylase family protein [Oceanirhabdus sp. W0125-5]|uniref:polysaccharide deacetylase family protein n=1 Tax=Oceanirhabdus sp. W0125-5 TaxID=2999116 RepID=UPI0022F2B15D|nr:polysaccharide deacetylase family protein [Oceanirhabdus sp. W0125-5]WBW97441.1 polysaccharide deacetylase [Oceanirhabdus sp. W0125-5]
MRKWTRCLVLLFLVFIIGVKPVKAVNNEIKELKCSNKSIKPMENIEYTIKTDGDDLIQVEFKVFDHNKKEILSYFQNYSPPFAAGDSIKVNTKFNKQGIYFIKVYLKNFLSNEIVNEKEIKVKCGNVIEEIDIPKKTPSKKEEEKKREPKGEKIAYLTFDDGPSANTYKVLEVLDKYNIKGTFFVLGKNAEKNKKTLKKIYDDGHVIGNHSYSHDYNYIYSDVDNLISEIKRTDELIKSVIEGYNNKLFRFPGGSFHRTEAKEAVDELGYKHFNWHIDSGDTREVLVSADKIAKNVLSNIWRDKVVILFHDAGAKKTTPDALPEIIEGLLDRGYRFEPLVEESFNSF